MRGEYFFAGICNYDCFFCIRDEVDMKITQTSNERFDEWVNLCHTYGIEEITLSSFNCEPTIQKDFQSIVLRLVDEGFSLSLRTNGSFRATPRMLEILGNFKTIWFSIQSFEDSIIQQIANVRRAPRIQELMRQLTISGVECRASIIVNRYNGGTTYANSDVIKTLDILNELPVTLVQLRKIYYESKSVDDVDLTAYNHVKSYVQSFPKDTKSQFDDYIVNSLKVSLWEDVILSEKGLKYFPATEIITDAGRIVPKILESKV